MCGLLSPVGMVMGRRELQQIDAGHGDPSARSIAQVAWVIGLIGTIILALSIAFLVVLFGVLAASGG